MTDGDKSPEEIVNTCKSKMLELSATEEAPSSNQMGFTTHLHDEEAGLADGTWDQQTRGAAVLWTPT